LDNGWVKNYRRIKDWEWYTTPNTAHLFQHLIREVNHKDGKWQGIEIKKGSMITSRNKLSIETGLTSQNVRTCLKHLENTGEITIKSTNKYSVITVCNYETYQSVDLIHNQQANQQLTSNQPATNQQPNHKQEVKNKKNEKKKPYNIRGELPDCVSDDLWKEFRRHRNGMKGSFSDYAEYLMAKKLKQFESEGYDPVELINKTIEKGWKDINPDWLIKELKNGKQTRDQGHANLYRKGLQDLYR